MFRDVYDIEDCEQAKGYFSFWRNMAIESNNQPFIKFANMIKAYWSGVVKYFDSKLTNGILEGINAKIQLLKRRARGFRNIKNLVLLVFVWAKF